MYTHFSIIILLSALLLGCANNSTSMQNNGQMGNLLLAEPAPMNQRSQLAISRYSHILGNTDLEDDQRAQLLHQRGTLYDSVGLSGLAHFDFNQAIRLKPDLAEAYNSMGVHFTQKMNFIQAYEAFDASLDINPDMEFAFLNRGIALYYGGRPDLAVQDLGTFYSKNASDPYRALWSYLASREIDELKALAELAKQRQQLDEQNWATQLVDLYLENTTETELLNALIRGVTSQQQLTDRLCEAYFYLGKYHSARGNKGVASNYFKLALSTNVFEYVEHRYARLELNLLRDETNKAVTNESKTQ
ncbi:lipoprotein NlpI [uncultured Paraglaciecola sp.]|uniref:lipoprotein NlpI n=1 Tax=uncultured Paraglaciecola sp. TaxID=1765024 RepID=UPI00261C519B|nr:lipoprotein NlpI [uncultured Paraglaciecola sp.]